MPNLNFGLGGNLNQSYASGGSTNTASNGSQGSGYSLNYPIAANTNAASAADIAYQRQKELNETMMNFNREEAQKARDWETEMANTIYTRSMKNMKEAGINPILAANLGLSAASVGSGATASIGGSSAPMAQTFIGSESANSSKSWGESNGSSWNTSEGGIATAIKALAGMAETLAQTASNSQVLIQLSDGIAKFYDDDSVKGKAKQGLAGAVLGALGAGASSVWGAANKIRKEAKKRAAEE